MNLRQGDERLLRDCATVTRFLGSDRSPAKTRLHTEVGEDLALFLLATLCESEASIPPGRARRRADASAAPVRAQSPGGDL